MKLIEIVNGIIEKGAASLPKLDSFLSGIAEKYPDAAPEIQEYLEKANEAVTPEGLVALGKTVMDEIVHFKHLDPRHSPSNLAG